MKIIIIILVVLLIVFGCNNEPKSYDNDFRQAKTSIRDFAKSYFDSSYVLIEGSVGSLKKFDQPIKTTNFLGSDTTKEKYKMVYYEQRHLCLPTTYDSINNCTWTYYQLDENFKVIAFSKTSISK